MKLIDFAVAEASFLAGMTATGILMGMPECMAPEQVRKDSAARFADAGGFGRALASLL